METPISTYKTVRVYGNIGASYFLQYASKMAYSIFGMSQLKMSIASFLTEEEKGYWFFRYNKNNGVAPQTEKEARKMLEEYKESINKRVNQAKENKLLPNDFPQLFPSYLKLYTLIPVFVDKRIAKWIAQYIVEIKSVDTVEKGENDFDKRVYTEIGVVEGESVMIQFNSRAILGIDYRHIPVPTLRNIPMFDLLPKEQTKNTVLPKVIYKSFPNQKYTLPFVQNTEGFLIPVTHLSVNALKNELIVLNNKKVKAEPLSDNVLEQQLKSKNIKGLYIGGDLEQAKCDIISIVNPICFASPSTTDIIFEAVPNCDSKIMKVAIIKDNNFPTTGIGFQLLEYLTKSKNAYLYQVADNAKSTLKPNGEALGRDGENGIYNTSITKRLPSDKDFSKGKVSPTEYLKLLNGLDGDGAIRTKFKELLLRNNGNERPLANDVKWEFDSIVTIMKNGEWYRMRSKTMTEIILRPDVVFHELWETYERTDNAEPFEYPLMNPQFTEDQITAKLGEPAYKLQRLKVSNSGKLKNSAERPLEYEYSTIVFGAHSRAENAAKNDTQVKPVGPVSFRVNLNTKSIPPKFCTSVTSKSWNRDRIKREESVKPQPNDYFLNW